MNLRYRDERVMEVRGNGMGLFFVADFFDDFFVAKNLQFASRCNVYVHIYVLIVWAMQ